MWNEKLQKVILLKINYFPMEVLLFKLYMYTYYLFQYSHIIPQLIDSCGGVVGAVIRSLPSNHKVLSSNAGPAEYSTFV